MKARTLLLTGLPANRRAKSSLRLAPILAATLAVGSCFPPAVRGTGPSDSLPSEDAKVVEAYWRLVDETVFGAEPKTDRATARKR